MMIVLYEVRNLSIKSGKSGRSSVRDQDVPTWTITKAVPWARTGDGVMSIPVAERQINALRIERADIEDSKKPHEALVCDCSVTDQLRWNTKGSKIE
jgi:hypothetical protein